MRSERERKRERERERKKSLGILQIHTFTVNYIAIEIVNTHYDVVTSVLMVTVSSSSSSQCCVCVTLISAIYTRVILVVQTQVYYIIVKVHPFLPVWDLCLGVLALGGIRATLGCLPPCISLDRCCPVSYTHLTLPTIYSV